MVCLLTFRFSRWKNTTWTKKITIFSNKKLTIICLNLQITKNEHQNENQYNKLFKTKNHKFQLFSPLHNSANLLPILLNSRKNCTIHRLFLILFYFSANIRFRCVLFILRFIRLSKVAFYPISFRETIIIFFRILTKKFLRSWIFSTPQHTHKTHAINSLY